LGCKHPLKIAFNWTKKAALSQVAIAVCYANLMKKQ